MRHIRIFCNFAFTRRENIVKTKYTSPKSHHTTLLHALTRHHMAAMAIVVPVATLAWLGTRALPANEDDMRRSVCLVDGQSNLGGVTGYDTITVATYSVHGQGTWINKHWCLPSCSGRVLTIQQGKGSTDQGPWLMPDSLPHLIAAKTDTLGALLHRKETERKELQYYLRCHGVQDEGYQRVAKYATKQNYETDSLAAIYKALKAHLAHKKTRLLRVGHYSVTWYDGDGRLQRTQCEPIVTPVGQLGKPVILRTADHSKPWATYAVRNTPLNFTLSKKIFTVKVNASGTTSNVLIVEGTYSAGWRHNFPRLFAPDGSPVFSSHGKFLGVISNNQVTQ